MLILCCLAYATSPAEHQHIFQIDGRLGCSQSGLVRPPLNYSFHYQSDAAYSTAMPNCGFLKIALVFIKFDHKSGDRPLLILDAFT
jgi:hypothetical protein